MHVKSNWQQAVYITSEVYVQVGVLKLFWLTQVAMDVPERPWAAGDIAADNRFGSCALSQWWNTHSPGMQAGTRRCVCVRGYVCEWAVINAWI